MKAECGIWQRTQSEINFYKDGKLMGTENGLVAYWPLDEGTGLIAGDASTNSTDGNFVNMDNSNWGEGIIGGGKEVTLTVTDASGNSTMAMADVNVFDTIPPTAICQNISIQLDGSGNASITANDIDAGSSDACGIASLSIDVATFTAANIGDNTVTLTATDNNGNTDTCHAIVTIIDNNSLMVLCKNITIQLDQSGNASIVAADIDNGTTGASTLTVDINTFTCNDIGDNTVKLIASDGNGNIDSCTAIVTVQDLLDPVAIANALDIYLDEFGNATITAADIDNGSFDNCGNVSLSIDSSMFDCNDVNIGQVGIRLNGSNEYLNMLNAPVANFGTGDFTLESWVKLNNVGPAQAVFGSMSNGFTLWISGGNLNGAIASNQFDISTGSVITANNWHHVAMVRQGNDAFLYVDGVLQASNSGFASRNVNTSVPLYYGAQLTGLYLGGSIDEGRMWNVARTQSEINNTKDRKINGH